MMIWDFSTVSHGLQCCSFGYELDLGLVGFWAVSLFISIVLSHSLGSMYTCHSGTLDSQFIMEQVDDLDVYALNIF